MLACLIAGTSFAATMPRPRAISPAERAALVLVLAHFEGDADAWWHALAPSAPLRQLGPSAAGEEIAVRVGAAEDATWTLVTPGPGIEDHHVTFIVEHASGWHDQVRLEMRETAEGQWQVERVLCLVDRWTQPNPGDPEAAPSERASTWLFLAIGFMGIRTMRHRRRQAFALGLGMVIVLACATDDPVTPTADSGRDPDAFTQLAPLAAYREALLADDRQPEDPVGVEVPPALEVEAALWRTQWALLDGTLESARDAFLEIPDEGHDRPLAALLGIELAHRKSDLHGLRTAFTEATRLGLDHDHLRALVAARMLALGDIFEPQPLLADAVEAGSRNADVYYLLATFAALDRDLDDLRTFAEAAWRLLPKPREDILGDPILATLAALPQAFPIFQLSTAEEPILPARYGKLEPLTLAPEQRASRVGDLLMIQRADRRLLVPGGGALAPREADALDAAAARNRERRRVLEDLDATVARAAESPSVLMDEQVSTLARALAEEDRWSDLVTLTRGIDKENLGRIPPLLVKMRAHALEETGRADEGRRLLIDLALDDRAASRRDPSTIYQLAESFVAIGEYDVALKLLARANTLSRHGGRPKRAEQIRMEQALMVDAERLHQGGFEIVYPRSTGERFPVAIAAVLEAERERLERWIPRTAAEPPIEVQLYPLITFLEAYRQGTGMLVLGLYDGRVRIPFADVASLDPRVVSIVSHELAHALIARATNDNAPHWLQEGVAEHVQMHQDRLNPFPELVEAERVLSVPVIDAALRGWCDPQFADLAYSEAAWILHFVESRHGADGIKRLIGSFQTTSDTDEALEKAFGQSLGDFQAQAVEWASRDAPHVWPTRVVRYDGSFLNRVLARHGLLPPGSQAVMQVGGPRPQGDPRLLPQGAQRPTPKLGVRLPPPPPPSAKPDAPSELLDWHRRYSGATAEAKGLLAEMLRGQRDGTIPGADLCRRFEAAVRSVLTGKSLEAPRPEVRGLLEGAFSDLHAAAMACVRGQHALIRPEIQNAETQLAIAARLLGPHGLRP